MAERVGFEATVEFPLHTLSKRAPSTARTSLRVFASSRLLEIKRLQAHAAQDVGELHPHLERRAEVLSRHAERALATRGEQEAREMQRILEAQRDRIEKQHEKALENYKQLTLGFSWEEERQFAANQKHWAARLRALEDEIRDEPTRIRAGYEVQATRVEPVGLVYLWPVSG